MLYRTSKLFHLIGLVLWLGPSTGGYILILLARYQQNPSVELWLFKEYLNLVHVEALGLAVLVTSGLIMGLSRQELFMARWLRIKLSIVFSVFIPLEGAQVYIYHRVIKRAFSTGEGINGAIALFDIFSMVSFILLAVTIPIVLWLAVLKPGLSIRRSSITINKT